MSEWRLSVDGAWAEIARVRVHAEDWAWANKPNAHWELREAYSLWYVTTIDVDDLISHRTAWRRFEEYLETK